MALKGGYAVELRFKDARSTVDMDLTVQRVTTTVGNRNQMIREMLQSAAGVPLGAPVIPSKLGWTSGPSLDFTWTRALVMW